MNITEAKPWPPAYTIRRSLRARQIILQIKPIHGLEIIIPSYRQRFNVQTILEEKRDWIEKMFKKMSFYENTVDPLPSITRLENPPQ